MITNQTIEELVNRSFNPISQKIDKLSLEIQKEKIPTVHIETYLIEDPEYYFDMNILQNIFNYYGVNKLFAYRKKSNQIFIETIEGLSSKILDKYPNIKNTIGFTNHEFENLAKRRNIRIKDKWNNELLNIVYNVETMEDGLLLINSYINLANGKLSDSDTFNLYSNIRRKLLEHINEEDIYNSTNTLAVKRLKDSFSKIVMNVNDMRIAIDNIISFSHDNGTFFSMLYGWDAEFTYGYVLPLFNKLRG